MEVGAGLKPYNGKFDPTKDRPYKISRSKIDLFLECPHCFYLDRVLAIKRPDGPAFTLNSAVDSLLKSEFDVHRLNGQKHPLQVEFGIDAEPVPHEKLGLWRQNFSGVSYLHEPTNFLIHGAIDDLWINSKGEYIVVDYKATAKAEQVTELGDKPWHDSYRRQIEVYQWLLRRNGLTVSNTGYWVYCTGRPNEPAFNKQLVFDVNVIAYDGNDSWIEPTIESIKQCLTKKSPPKCTVTCDYCNYTQAAKAYV